MGIFSFLFAGPAPTETAPRKPLRKSYETYEDIPTDYTVIDIETSGLDACTCEILEIGAIKVRNDVEIDHYQTYIKPVGAISKSASEVNGLTWKKLHNQPSLEDIRQSFFNFIGDDILVGHNIGFDIKFIQTRFETTLPNKCFDTLEWSRIAFPTFRNHKLDTLRSAFSLGGASHSAIGDCSATHRLLQRIAKSDVKDKILLNEILHKYSKNLDNPVYSEPAYNDTGREYWESGDKARINGDIKEALALFQRAEAAGYNCPVLYSSYAMAYRKLKDYEKEIAITEKALQLYTGQTATWFEDRNQRAKNLLLAQKKREELVQQKEKEREIKAESRRKKAELATSKPKQSTGKSIAQCLENGTIIKEFESVASAAREIGISDKCIRDAASGKQKHAGGFCWKYIGKE